MVGGRVLLVVVHSALALRVHMLGAQRARLVVLNCGHALTLLHKNAFDIITGHRAGAWIALGLLPLGHQLGTVVVIVVAWAVQMDGALVMLARVIAVDIRALPDAQSLLINLLAWSRAREEGVGHLRKSLSRSPLSKVGGAV